MESVKLVSDILYDNLLQSILSKEWKVGDKIPSENEICGMYHSSRVSVRAALHKLQAKGFIITRPGKGSFVSEPNDGANNFGIDSIDLSANDYKHMIELRRALEFTSIEIMAEEGTAQDFQELKNACRNLIAADNAKSYVDADFHFHYAIIKGSHNPAFIRIYDIFHDELYKYLYEMSGNNRDNNWDNAKRNHLAILDAICNHDAKKAIAVIQGTFDANYKRLHKYFKKES
ncbi:MAG: FadR/GntR family transcriptional regulator [Sphaerochaetaceae bacterium]|jgi:DNA-binding FadR family transcriptional regulator